MGPDPEEQEAEYKLLKYISEPLVILIFWVLAVQFIKIFSDINCNTGEVPWLNAFIFIWAFQSLEKSEGMQWWYTVAEYPYATHNIPLVAVIDGALVVTGPAVPE